MEHVIFEIAQRELGILKDFQKVLREERDAIIAFSVEGIIRENNKKEELLKKLEFLEMERRRLMEELPDLEKIFETDRWKSISESLRKTLNEINDTLRKNISLLSFSVDYVRNSIENIVDLVNKSSYGKTAEARISIFPAREI